jgi:hypothetical protein
LRSRRRHPPVLSKPRAGLLYQEPSTQFPRVPCDGVQVLVRAPVLERLTLKVSPLVEVLVTL